MSPEKRKSAVAIMLGKIGPKPAAEEEPAEDESSMGLETAMSELMAAFKSGDAKAAATAWQAALDCGPAATPPAEDSYEDDDDEDM